MVWLILLLAGMFETAWAIGLKYTAGFSRLWPSVFTMTTMALSVFLLAQAMKSLPLGTAYAIWTGIGAVGAVIMGIILFNEPVTAPRIFCLSLIVSGIIGLKLVSTTA